MASLFPLSSCAISLIYSFCTMEILDSIKKENCDFNGNLTHCKFVDWCDSFKNCEWIHVTEDANLHAAQFLGTKYGLQLNMGEQCTRFARELALYSWKCRSDTVSSRPISSPSTNVSHHFRTTYNMNETEYEIPYYMSYVTYCIIVWSFANFYHSLV